MRAAGLAALVLAVFLVSCGGEDKPQRDLGRDRLLIEAARRGAIAEVRRLLEDGASVSAVDSTGATALVAAAYGNHVETARLLVEAGPM